MSVMASVCITLDRDAVVSEVRIEAPPERVFAALIDSKQVMQWWTGAKCRTKEFAIEPFLGGRWSLVSTEHLPNETRRNVCSGEVTAFDPPRLLAYTWIAEWHEKPEKRTEVMWELTPTAGGTLLKITHSGLSDLSGSRDSYSGGWPGVAESLKRFVELDR